MKFPISYVRVFEDEPDISTMHNIWIGKLLIFFNLKYFCIPVEVCFDWYGWRPKPTYEKPIKKHTDVAEIILKDIGQIMLLNDNTNVKFSHENMVDSVGKILSDYYKSKRVDK